MGPNTANARQDSLRNMAVKFPIDYFTFWCVLFMIIPYTPKKVINFVLTFGFSKRNFLDFSDEGLRHSMLSPFVCGSYEKHHVSSNVTMDCKNASSLSASLMKSPLESIRCYFCSLLKLRGTNVSQSFRLL